MQKFIPALKSNTPHLDFFHLKTSVFHLLFRPKIHIQIFEYVFSHFSYQVAQKFCIQKPTLLNWQS